jgi:hypothetical protein
METGYYISNNRKIILNSNLEILQLIIDQSNVITVVKCNKNLKKMFLENRGLDPFRKIEIGLNENLEYLKITLLIPIIIR